MQKSFTIFNIMLLTASFIGWSGQEGAVGNHRRGAYVKNLENNANAKYSFEHNRSEQAEEFAASPNRFQDDVLMVLDQILKTVQEMRTFLKDKIIRMKINEIHRLLKQVNDHSNLLKESNVLVESVLQKLNNLKNHEYCKQTEQGRFIKNRLKRDYVLKDKKKSDEALILQAILSDIEELKSRNFGYKCKENFPCEATGTWLSEQGGVLLNISYSSPPHINLNIKPKTPPRQGILSDGEWILTGINPYNRHNRIAITAANMADKQMAVFIGECKVCGGLQKIVGQWIVSSPTRTCHEQMSSQRIVGDVWRKEALFGVNERQKKRMLRRKLSKRVYSIF